MTAPATPTLTPLETIDFAVEFFEECHSHAPEWKAAEAWETVTELVEAALAWWDTYHSVNNGGPAWALLADLGGAALRYRAWTPTPATGGGDSGEADTDQ